MMLWKCFPQYASKFGKVNSGHKTGKGQFSFQSQRRPIPKNVQSTTQLHSFNMLLSSLQFSSVIQSCPNLRNPMDLHHSRFPCPDGLKFMSIESVMTSNHLIFCLPFLLLPSIFPSIRVFASESLLPLKRQMYWSFSFSITLSNEQSGLISFRIDWFNLLAIQRTLKSLLQYHSSQV